MTLQRTQKPGSPVVTEPGNEGAIVPNSFLPPVQSVEEGGALEKLEAICEEIFELSGDYSPGKLLLALWGEIPNYRADVTEVRAALASHAAMLEALERLMEQPTKNPLDMTPDERRELWAAHEAARAALALAKGREK